MAQSPEPVTLRADEAASILAGLRTARHNVNNCLSLVIAAAELVKLKPQDAQRLADQILEQPDRIMAELRGFSAELEKRLGAARD